MFMKYFNALLAGGLASKVSGDAIERLVPFALALVIAWMGRQRD